MNWQQGLSCVVPADCPSPLQSQVPSLPTLLSVVAADALCSRQTPKRLLAPGIQHQEPGGHCASFLPTGPTGFLPSWPIQRSPGCCHWHPYTKPHGFLTAPCWSEDSDRRAHLSPGAVYSPMRLPHTLPPQQTSQGKLVALRPSEWTRPPATATLWVCSFSRVHGALCDTEVFTWTRSERCLHQLWNSQPLAPHLEGHSLTWNLQCFLPGYHSERNQTKRLTQITFMYSQV